jgi:hypothetical protein
MDHLRGFPGTTVHIEAGLDGRVVATIHWDGVSGSDPIWWGSDEMCTLTPEEAKARTALAPVFAACARRAAPALPPAAPKPSLWRRLLSALDTGPARCFPHE